MTVYKGKNGKWYCRFKIHGEQKHLLCQGAKSKVEAKAIEDAEKYKLRQIQAGLIEKNEVIKFAVLYKLYNQYAKLNKKSYTNDCYFINILKNYFPPETICNKLTMTDFEMFKIKLRDERNSSKSTINKYLNIISKMYNLAIAEKILTENPLKNVKRYKEDNHKIRYLTKSEEEKLFNAIDELYPHIKPIIICALQTGMRKSEIFNLQWANINYDYNYIELLETKSGKARKIPISDKLNKVFSKQSKNYNYVFTNLDTGLPYKDIHKSFNAVLKKANIKNFRFHDLRHTVATRLVEQGVPLPVVQEILGHSKIETTMRYAHAIPEQKINAINLLSNYC
ncbi:MAG: tyrosine-type recombinase/integrase [Erysipelotrichaceae bacterium]|nr:tyrosine-type recombinase/integrase [Erysipelotrichaceae bacterium]